MNLAINYYQPNHAQRQQELDHCIVTNYQQQLFTTIINFSDTHNHQQLQQLLAPITSTTRLIHAYHQYRPKFNQIIQYLNTHHAHQTCIITNLDILFNQTILYVHLIDLHNKMLCLTRWEPTSTTWQDNVIKHFRGQWCLDKYQNLNHHSSTSQDVWIFAAPLTIPLHLADFPQGILGCEKIGKIARQAGYETLNPCHTIKCYHHHASQYRTYDPTFYLDHQFNQTEPIYLNYHQ